jgi:hypothetical protein
MDTSPTPRPLTYDEQRASEAAFLGLPAQPSWTQGAQRIYAQLTQALAKKRPPAEVTHDGLRPRPPSLPLVNGNHQPGPRPLSSLAPLTARASRTTCIRARSTASREGSRTDDRGQVARSRLSTRSRHLRRICTPQHCAGGFQSTSRTTDRPYRYRSGSPGAGHLRNGPTTPSTSPLQRAPAHRTRPHEGPRGGQFSHRHDSGA